MAYFLPSYFQKRLLRYALTRLDFIETDALNLEDLDITLGQRSVIELKNVGIRVHKLIGRLQIPPSVVLNRASIRLLRITIPADLHISGIEVELDGVDVQVELREYVSTETKPSGLASGRKDVASRPRIDAPSLHDPGGKRASLSAGETDRPHVIPTSQDLATSFLESEPVQEREELEAAIQSQSYRLGESTASLDTTADESGIGMPGGFSLPGFVAKFFAGVADRLSVGIKNVAVSVAIGLNGESSLAGTIMIMIKVAAISLDGIQSTDDIPYTRSQRSVGISGLEVFLLSEHEAFSRPSNTSSPKLARSRSKMSSETDDNDLQQFESPEQPIYESPSLSRTTLPQRQHSGANISSEGSASSSQLADLSIDLGDPLLESSSDFRPSLVASAQRRSYLSQQNESPRPLIDNRRRAEDSIRSGNTARNFSDPATTQDVASEDLAESKMFTHDEAESMYMSAVSEVDGMPGAWNSLQPARLEDQSAIDDRARIASPQTRQHNSGLGVSFRETGENEDEEESDPLHLVTSQSDAPASDSPLADLVAKKLVFIDQLTFTFPSSIQSNEPDPLTSDQAVLEPRYVGSAVTTTGSNNPLARARDNKADASASRLMQSTHMRSLSKDFVVATDYDYAATVGDVSINLDMTVGRMLIAAISQLNHSVPAKNYQAKPKSEKEAVFSMNLTIRSISFNICQSIPEIAASEAQKWKSRGGEDISVAETCLLQLELKNLNHELAINPEEKRQRLAVERIVLGHAAQKYLYFVDSFGVRDSVASSLMLRPNDLVVTNLDDRFEVQIKPVYVVVDLLKVDDVLSRSGGLSSILDLGNSIISTGTATEHSSKPKTQPTRQRTVRFDNPTPKVNIESDTTTSGMKIDVRISGAVLDLIGSESSVQIRSSAIKLVSRTGNFRAQIDTIVLTGPVLGKSQTKPGVNVKITNLSLHYKDTPDEEDLDRLLSLLTPSGNKYDDEDDIMVDTLIRQRRKGAVLRLNVNDVKTDVSGTSWLKHVAQLADEMSKLATVTKYLPEDDRPGILTFGLISRISVNIDFGRSFGILHLFTDLLEGAIISVPSLMAAQLNSFSLKRGKDSLIGDMNPDVSNRNVMGSPMLMCRFIADEMEPTIRIKLANTCLEYTVPTLIAVTGLLETFQTHKSPVDAASSERMSEISSSPSDKSDFTRKVQISLAVRDSAIALNPSTSSARGLTLLSDAVLTHRSKKPASKIQLDLRKASILIIDDITKMGNETANADQKLYFEENDQVQELTKAGYVPVASISNASAVVNITEDEITHSPLVDIEFRNNLFLMESCADSTQTLIQILSSLAPPSPPSPVAKYRTEVVPIQDMLASFTGNAFVSEPGPELGLEASQLSVSTTDHNVQEDYDSESDDGLQHMYDEEEDDTQDRMTESYLESEMAQSRTSGLHIAPVNLTATLESSMDQSIMAHSMLDFRTDHFVHKSSVGGTAHRWNSAQNTYGLGSENRTQESPLKVRVRDMHIIWNLFDGYDWQNTRDTISQAVKDIETKAMARKPRRRDSRMSPGVEEDEAVIGDFLFNSIYIGIPANKDPRELANAINQDIGDMTSETGSHATGTTITASSSGRAASARSKPKRLRLNRSRQHKMTFELKGVSADVIAFPPGSGEIESSIDVRIKMLEIFDHVPTSTWKKFATYMHEAGEREIDTNMVHLELLNVKPVAELSASEIVLKLTVLPLRLHVDQDALDFLTRFFEFKDDRTPASTAPSAPPFIQRAEVNPIRLRLDFKPKRVDYGGLRSGRTTEFMNFFVLDRSDMVLRRVILYGVSGFDRLGIMLNNIWTPDVKRNQLPGVLAGLAPIRSLVDVGSGVKDLVAVPIREYKKDGRIVRSIQKGTIAFAKTTTTELVNLGAKLAIGTQTVLQNAEEMLVPRPQSEDNEGEKEQISLYADQPTGIVQGLRGAYASLERDLLLARDAIVAVPGEVMASGSATDAAKAIIRQSPTIILRPAIGASKAVGQTLLGAGNTLDKGNLRRIEDKYKHR